MGVGDSEPGFLMANFQMEERLYPSKGKRKKWGLFSLLPA